MSPRTAPRTASLDLYWIPLGAGGRVVRLSGRVYEALLSLAQRRKICELYHSVLVAELPDGTTTIEVGPVWDAVAGATERGQAVSGPVGLRMLGRWSWFRYEVRCWHDGVISDLAAAVGGPVRLTTDETLVRRALSQPAAVPPLTWGRDELDLGEMWNSNSVIAWILVQAGIDASTIRPPAGGRAPGLSAGLALSRRTMHGRITQRPMAGCPRHGNGGAVRG